ncbi:MAG: YfiR family protein [Pseudomonadota bacterium]|nr:YfiR family protein [Pseudomonadota bacterium]
MRFFLYSALWGVLLACSAGFQPAACKRRRLEAGATGKTWIEGAIATTLILLLLLLAAPARAALEENEVKAAVVYHLSLFAEWPAASPRAGSFNLCVLTENEAMADTLSRLAGKTVKGVNLVVRRLRPMHDPVTCQMVYLGEMSDAVRGRAIAQLIGQPVLTISNGGAPAPGAIVSIGVAGERVYFDIDLPVAQRAGLRLDAKLLRLARNVVK